MKVQSLMGAVASALALGIAAYTPSAVAQSSGIVSAETSTCNITGNVTVTVLGIPVSTPLGCVNGTQQTAAGNDDSALVGTTALGVPMVANVASVDAPYGESDWTNLPNTTILSGEAGASEVSLVQGGVRADDVAGWVLCRQATGHTMQCFVAMTLGSLEIGGQPVSLPPEPIPQNYAIPISNLTVAVNVAGIGLVNVSTNGALILNKVVVTGGNTMNPTINHTPLSISLSGSTSVVGIGLVSIKLNVDDASLIALILNDNTRFDQEIEGDDYDNKEQHYGDSR